MTRDQIIEALRRTEPLIREAGVSAIYLFGSSSRNEAGPESDVDLFVDYDPQRFGLIELARLRRTLSDALGRPADLTTRDSLHPMLRGGIEREAARVF